MKPYGAPVVFAALLAACARHAAANYKNCLTLRVGMAKDALFQIMGAPEETIPYVAGKSMEYLKGRTAYEWPNPISMPGPDHVSVDDATGKITAIRCSDVEIRAAVGQ